MLNILESPVGTVTPLDALINILNDIIDRKCPPAFDILQDGGCNAPEATTPTIGVNLANNRLNVLSIVNSPNPIAGTIRGENDLSLFRCLSEQ